MVQTVLSGDPEGMASTGILLIVDDNAAVASAVRTYMSRVGDWSAVVIAPDAGRALLLATEHTPAAIVLDNRMPGGNGIDVLADLRRACPDAVIVMHTSEDTLELRQAAQLLGADTVVSKGRPLGELAAALATPDPTRVAWPAGNSRVTTWS